MKKGILIWSILLVACISTSFANGKGDITNNVMTSFKQEFANAQVINWENSDNFIKLTFKMNDLVMFAYYSKNAELLAVSRNILSSQLPINLLRDLKRNFKGYWITDLFEMDANGETVYFVKLENPDNFLVLRAPDPSAWQIYQKQKKNLE